ncbi:MAG: peptidoglycan DD-metalloendopeptidase family protein [Gemmatimonadales bacterium]
MSVRSSLALAALAFLAAPTALNAQADALPELPDSSGWGVHVLTVQRDPAGAIWVGTYGKGIFRLRPGEQHWDVIRQDTTDTSISWDFVHAFGFGAEGQIWYGTIGNGWGLSTDDGRTWRNWTFGQLGPEWQYVAPGGIAVRGDTVVVATADGLQVTTDDGIHWTALVDTTGPAALGPADTALAVLREEYVTGLTWDEDGILIRNPSGWQRLRVEDGQWRSVPVGEDPSLEPAQVEVGEVAYRPSPCGLRPAAQAALPCITAEAPMSTPPEQPKTTWFERPIGPEDNRYIDQTYRYGSTMGGNFQQHQGVEFNNSDGTPVMAIGSGTVLYAGPAEAGALTVGIRHDTTVMTTDGSRAVFSVYYHNSALLVEPGDRVETGQVISRVGNTGRATNDHMHLEVHVAPADSIGAVVDSLERYPPYTTNPELWIKPLKGGIVAGRVLDADGEPVRQAHVYGLRKDHPRETPFSFVETYDDRAHPHPLYQENFAIGDVPPGEYTLGVEVDGRRIYRRIVVEPNKVTWVEFR